MSTEANAHPVDAVADWGRPDGMHLAFNFPHLNTGQDATTLEPWCSAPRRPLTRSTPRAPGYNHDASRPETRFGSTTPVRLGDGIGPRDPQPDLELGRARARAATFFMLALPGGAYLYQGEALGLPDHTTLEDRFRQDPSFFRTAGERAGSDACRVPLPWTPQGPTLGVGDFMAPTVRRLGGPGPPCPGGRLGGDLQTLEARRRLKLGSGGLRWLDTDHGAGIIAFENSGIVVVLNMSQAPVDLPSGSVLVVSCPEAVQSDTGAPRVAQNAAIWLQPEPR